MTIALTDVTGIGANTCKQLMEHGYECAEDLATATLAGLSVVPGFSEVRAGRVIAAAQALTKAAATAKPTPAPAIKEAKTKKEPKNSSTDKVKKEKKTKKDKKDKKKKKK